LAAAVAAICCWRGHDRDRRCRGSFARNDHAPAGGGRRRDVEAGAGDVRLSAAMLAATGDVARVPDHVYYSCRRAGGVCRPCVSRGRRRRYVGRPPDRLIEDRMSGVQVLFTAENPVVLVRR
jgi:hypothetical protein